MEFKWGDKARVEAFDVTVVSSISANGTVEVRDAEGFVHHVFAHHLTKLLPYVDGKMYIDADEEVFIFRAAMGYCDGPGWEQDGKMWPPDYAARPIREIGPEIEE